MRKGFKIANLIMCLFAAAIVFAGMSLTTYAYTALPANESDAGDGNVYFVGFTPGEESNDGSAMFDGVANNKACVYFNEPYSIEFTYSVPIIPTTYFFRTGGDTDVFTGRNPSAWKLEGQNSDGTWTEIDAKSDQYYTTASDTAIPFSISSNTKAYTKFRLTINAANPDGYDWCRDAANTPIFQLSEVYMSGKKAPEISQTVTFKVVGGSWDDGTAEDKTVTLSGYEGDTLKLTAEQIPAVGSKPNDSYKAGNWDVTPSTDTAIAEETTYTYTYVQEEPAEEEPAKEETEPAKEETEPAKEEEAGSTGYVEDVTGSNEAGGSYTFGQKIVNNDNLKTLLSLSDDEINQGTKVWLDVTDLGSNVSDEDKTLIDGAKGDYTAGLYLDINLYKKVGNNDAVKVTKTNGKVTVSVVIPENLRQDGRTFEIIRVHDGKASVINGTYDASTGVFTFETELFSTYVIAYKDRVAEQPASNTSTSTDTSSAAPTATTTSDGLPKTGDHSGMLIWLCMLLASMSVLGVTGYRFYKR